jgi:hypothetical protein
LAQARATVAERGGFVIRNLEGLCRYWHADTPEGLNRRVYKATECGASVSVYLRDGRVLHCGDPAWRGLPMDTPIEGFTVQTIVEGSDATVDSDLFTVPVASVLLDDWVAEMESLADDIWNEANINGK